MAGKRTCRVQGCPAIIPSSQRWCPQHAAEHDARRGTAEQRGYGRTFQQKRRLVKPDVESGRARCWRCGEVIRPTDRWHLGHDDLDRGVIRGPEHEHCNTSAAGRASH